jgi:hypothetical protein
MVLDPQVIGCRSLFRLNSGGSQSGDEPYIGMGKDLSNFAVVGARLNSEGIIRARFQPVSHSHT